MANLPFLGRIINEPIGLSLCEDLEETVELGKKKNQETGH